jgi:NADH-quinone oxidoreductase subunit J
VEWKKALFSAIASIAGAFVTIITLLDFKFSATTEAAKEVNMRLVGNSLLSVGKDGYALPFEVITVLLLAAMIGAIVIAKKAGPKNTDTQTTKQL